MSRFGKEERDCILDAVEDAVKAAEYMVNGRTDAAMNEFNAKKRE